MSRLHRSALLAIFVLAMPTMMVQAQDASAPLAVKTFTLRYLQPHDAASLVSPYIQSRGGGVFEAGRDVQAITVRETPEVLARVDSLLRSRDRVPATVVFRFQLIAAEDTAVHDPAIAGLDSTLRGLFRFAGYRLLSEGTATAGGHQDFRLTMGAGDNRFEVDGNVRGLDMSDRTRSVQLRVQLIRETGTYQGKSLPPEILLETGLTVPQGQTVVLGSAAPRGEGRALILSVRPEIASSDKR